MLDCDLIKEERKGEVAGVVAIEERKREIHFYVFGGLLIMLYYESFVVMSWAKGRGGSTHGFGGHTSVDCDFSVGDCFSDSILMT